MLNPVQDKIVLKIKKDEEVTKSGIILGANSKFNSQVGLVIAVGPGIINNGVRSEMEVKEGDNVFIEKGIGIEIKYEEEEYLVVTQKDILAIIK